MPKKIATAEPTPEPATVQAVITNDGPHRQAVNVNDIVADTGVLGFTATDLDRSTYLTMDRNMRNGVGSRVPVLLRRGDGYYALLRFLPVPF
jgi:hypothetical protein